MKASIKNNCKAYCLDIRGKKSNFTSTRENIAVSTLQRDLQPKSHFPRLLKSEKLSWQRFLFKETFYIIQILTKVNFNYHIHINKQVIRHQRVSNIALRYSAEKYLKTLKPKSTHLDILNRKKMISQKTNYHIDNHIFV